MDQYALMNRVQEVIDCIDDSMVGFPGNGIGDNELPSDIVKRAEDIRNQAYFLLKMLSNFYFDIESGNLKEEN